MPRNNPACCSETLIDACTIGSPSALVTMPAGPICVQRVGLSLEAARHLVDRYAVNGHVPEPLRVAHLIAGAVATGESRGRA